MVKAMTNEQLIRGAFFFGIFLTMALWELVARRRPLSIPKARRWAGNLGVTILNAFVISWLSPMTAMGTAVIAKTRGWGLLNNVPLPAWATFVLAVALLDFAIYLQHAMFHALPLFWRLHRMHHADLDIDVTTGLRFHPIEMLLSMLIKVGVVAALGCAPTAVLAFEVLLNSTSMFNHGNVRMPATLDRVLRLLVVTPDMHRVHHSVVVAETDSNFGFSLPWWDRLLGTYRAQPAAGHDGMTIGLTQFRDSQSWSLPRMLAIPFVGDAGEYPIGQGQKT
jgi:sterol desaturase/sphingolipid hydroxylase (fatty acid hydroxylase superfamily)